MAEKKTTVKKPKLNKDGVEAGKVLTSDEFQALKAKKRSTK